MCFQTKGLSLLARRFFNCRLRGLLRLIVDKPLNLWNSFTLFGTGYRKDKVSMFLLFQKWYLTNYQPSMDILTIYHSMDAPKKTLSMTQRHTVFSLLPAIGSIQAALLQLLVDQLALLQNLPKVVRLILQVGANVLHCIVTAQTGGCSRHH